MKQKYLILKDNENKKLKITGVCRTEQGGVSLLCEETYDYQNHKICHFSRGPMTLISALRTNNLYPPGIYAEKIAAAVVELIKSKDQESAGACFLMISSCLPKIVTA